MEEDGGGGDGLVYDQTERVIFFTLVPFYILAIFGSVAVITAVTFLPKLRKPRHIFQVGITVLLRLLFVSQSTFFFPFETIL